MEDALLRASDEAVETAFTALVIAATDHDRARDFRASYSCDTEVARGIEMTVQAAADRRLDTARRHFTSAVLQHSFRVLGPEHPGIHIQR